MPSRITGTRPILHGEVLRGLVVAADDPLALGAHAGQDVQRRAEDLIDQRVMNRGDLLPGGEAVGRTHAPCAAVHVVQFAVLADPEVRERIDAQHLVAVRRGEVDDLDQA